MRVYLEIKKIKNENRIVLALEKASKLPN